MGHGPKERLQGAVYEDEAGIIECVGVRKEVGDKVSGGVLFDRDIQIGKAERTRGVTPKGARRQEDCIRCSPGQAESREPGWEGISQGAEGAGRQGDEPQAEGPSRQGVRQGSRRRADDGQVEGGQVDSEGEPRAAVSASHEEEGPRQHEGHEGPSSRPEIKVGKLTRARAALVRQAERDQAVAVSLSGGKDSLVVLDLCCRTFPVVEAYFLYLVPGLEAVEAPARAAAKKQGVPLTVFPHWNLAEYMRRGIFHHRVRQVPRLKFKTAERYIRLKMGIEWIAYGHRQSDSYNRRLFLEDAGHVEEHTSRLYPIYDWVDRDVRAYMKMRNIPTPPTYGQTGRSSGFDLTSECMEWLRKSNRRDYEKVLQWFSVAEIIGGQE